ncbi:cupin-like domain-containing protein [Fulvivirga sp. 29W222]|uniref:Cupin-like domain-containing protein n=1 Tax=Fulvivirga marina TaxID=2494733 RepID=A0A937KED2_9BACT|nr:cupin-like domain-containing protein [Fulvivirga marina]MBL6449612.1 cupin-like domain-containing protein [Fulvivirga marina]
MYLNKVKRDIFGAIPGIENAATLTEFDAESLSPEEFKRNWVDKNRPCIIRGAVKHWPAVDKWKSKEYWQSVTSSDYHIDINPNRNYNKRERQVEHTKRVPFREAMEMLFTSSDDHVWSIPSEVISENSAYPKLLDDMKGFKFLPDPEKPRGFPACRFFLYKNASTGWHYHDCDETLMCQVNGDKDVALISADLPKADYVTNFLNDERYTYGEKLDPNLKFESFVVSVKEGDALYIPINWFHAVVPTQSDVGVTIAYCWANHLRKYGEVSNYLVRRMYKQVIWPVGLYTFLMPLIFCYSVSAYYLHKLFKSS